MSDPAQTRASEAAAGVDLVSDPVWAALSAYAFDDPEAELPFTARLARENGWPAGYAQAVVEEYRRFCYLAVRAEELLTPSEDVDQAWHLHLIYTHEYWGNFCANVLKTDLHHGPTRGGTLEAGKFRAAYGRTLDLYRQTFGESPPDAIWPPPARRFSNADRFRRINRGLYWVVPKLRPRDAAMMLIAVVGLLVIWLD